jgi:TetR/AcrR family transcriptional regulator, mexJK operon transcriptional repressor
VQEVMNRGRGRPKTASDAAQRSAITAAAKKLFLEKGYGNSTTGDLTARCKISKHTLYRLFPSKAALFAAVVTANKPSWLDFTAADDELPLEEALARIFRIDISPDADQERLAFVRLVVTESRHSPELAEILRESGSDVARAELAHWLARHAARGRILVDDAGSLARMLMDMIFGAIILKGVGELEWPGSIDRQAHIRRCIAVFLNGVRPRIGRVAGQAMEP